MTYYRYLIFPGRCCLIDTFSLFLVNNREWCVDKGCDYGSRTFSSVFAGWRCCRCREGHPSVHWWLQWELGGTWWHVLLWYRYWKKHFCMMWTISPPLHCRGWELEDWELKGKSLLIGREPLMHACLFSQFHFSFNLSTWELEPFTRFIMLRWRLNGFHVRYNYFGKLSVIFYKISVLSYLHEVA